MQFVAKEDIDTPIDDMFAAISDFAGFERSAIRRGAEVERQGRIDAPDAGLSWKTSFHFRGAKRTVDLKLAEFNPPSTLRIAGVGSSLEGDMEVELIALSPRRTRMTVKAVLRARSLPGRLLLQSLKLGRGKIARKFKKRVSEFAQVADDRWRQTG